MSLLTGDRKRQGPPPVFVGGTGRSGTTVTAAVLGQHPDYANIPVELRFHVDRGGIPDLLSGLVGLDSFVARLKEFWFRRELPNGETRGLHKVLDEAFYYQEVDRFASTYESDPWDACAVLVDRLLSSYAESKGKPGWIEMTPDNVYVGGLLARLFPGMRMVHSVRDPRGVVCSVVPLAWGPGGHRLGMAWWAERMYRAGEQSQLMPDGYLLTVFLEDLVGADSGVVAARLTEFLGCAPSPAMKEYLDSDVTRERAHLDRWRSDPEMTLEIIEYSQQLIAGLMAHGVGSVDRYLGGA